MSNPDKVTDAVLSKPLLPKNRDSAPLGRLGLTLLGLVACFSLPLYELLGVALKSDLYSHIVLVPFISAYLIWTKKSQLPAFSAPDHKTAAVFLGLAFLALASSFGFILTQNPIAPGDSLPFKILAFLFFLSASCAWFLGRNTLRALAFPLAFLVFMVPFPDAVRNGLETFLQYGSAYMAHIMFKIAGTTVFYDDLLFRLPGINLEVAPECSGIRSSLALFITSVVAGHFFLRSPWKCALLTLAVIPLAIIRNGFRIFTIGELCVHISPDMIHSYIHRHGGPIFFALSLIPFLLLLRFLYKSEQPGKPSNLNVP